MKNFIAQHSRQISGTLQCFDRVIFKGHLKNISYADGLEKFIARRGLKIKDFADFVKNQANQLVLHAKTIAEEQHRPYRYLESRIRKDDEARNIAQKLNIKEGLICIFSELETCPSFKIAYGIGRPRIAAARRKCLCIYLCFSATDLLKFLGKKLAANFTSEVITDFKTRVEGTRIKHRVGKNWIKMYDKAGIILRVETVINHPYGFLTRRHGVRKGKNIIGWFPMTKGVTGLYRYAEVARTANVRYLQALTTVHNPHKAQQLICACANRVTHNQK